MNCPVKKTSSASEATKSQTANTVADLAINESFDKEIMDYGTKKLSRAVKRTEMQNLMKLTVEELKIVKNDIFMHVRGREIELEFKEYCDEHMMSLLSQGHAIRTNEFESTVIIMRPTNLSKCTGIRVSAVGISRKDATQKAILNILESDKFARLVYEQKIFGSYFRTHKDETVRMNEYVQKNGAQLNIKYNIDCMRRVNCVMRVLYNSNVIFESKAESTSKIYARCISSNQLLENLKTIREELNNWKKFNRATTDAVLMMNTVNVEFQMMSVLSSAGRLATSNAGLSVASQLPYVGPIAQGALYYKFVSSLEKHSSVFFEKLVNVMDSVSGMFQGFGSKMSTFVTGLDLLREFALTCINVTLAAPGKKLICFILNFVNFLGKYMSKEAILDLIQLWVGVTSFPPMMCETNKIEVDMQMNFPQLSNMDYDIFKVSASFMLVFIGICTQGTVPGMSLLTTGVKRFGELSRGITSINGMFKTFESQFTEIIDWFGEQIGIVKIDPLEKMIAGVDAWMKKIQDLTTRINGEKKSDLLQKDLSIALHIEQLFREGMEFSREIGEKRLKAELIMPFHVHFNYLKELYKLVDMSGTFGNKPRIESCVFMIYGGSGVGKSGVTWPLAVDLNHMLVGDSESANFAREIYFRRTDQEFWDGYTGQNIVVYDDFGQVKDTTAKPNTEFIEVIRGANIATYPLHMAQLEDKRKTKFVSKVILLSANILNQDIKSLTFPDAFYRRLDLCYQVRVKDEFSTPFIGKNGVAVNKLDIYKVHEITGKDLSTDIYVFDRVNAATQQIIEANLSYEDILKQCHTIMSVKVKKSANMINELANHSQRKLTNLGIVDYDLAAKLSNSGVKKLKVVINNDSLPKVLQNINADLAKQMAPGTDETIEGFLLKYDKETSSGLVLNKIQLLVSDSEYSDYDSEEDKEDFVSIPKLVIPPKTSTGKDNIGAWARDESVHSGKLNKTFLMNTPFSEKVFNELCQELNEVGQPINLDSKWYKHHFNRLMKKEVSFQICEGMLNLKSPLRFQIPNEQVNEDYGREVSEWYEYFSVAPHRDLEVFGENNSMVVDISTRSNFLDLWGLSEHVYNYCGRLEMTWPEITLDTLRRYRNKATEKCKSVIKSIKEFVEEHPYITFAAASTAIIAIISTTYMFMGQDTEENVKLIEKSSNDEITKRKPVIKIEKSSNDELTRKKMTIAIEGDYRPEDVVKSYPQKFRLVPGKIYKIGDGLNAFWDCIELIEGEVEKSSGDEITHRKPVIRIEKGSGDEITRKRQVVQIEADMEMWRDETAQMVISHRVQQNLYRVATALDAEGNEFVQTMNGLFIRGRCMLVNKHAELMFKRNHPYVLIENYLKQRYVIPCDEIKRYQIYNSLGEEKDAMLWVFPKHVHVHSDLIKHFVESYDMQQFTSANIVLPTMRYDERADRFNVCLLGSGNAKSIDNPIHLYDNKLGFECMIREGYTYPLNTIAGDCGSPLVINEKSILRKICGIHSAGSQLTAYGTAISQKDLLRTLEGIPVDFQVQLDLDNIIRKFDSDKPIEVSDGFFPHGLVDKNKRVHGATKTQLRHSSVFGMIKENTTKPAQLLSQNAEFMRKQISKGAKFTPCIPDLELDVVYQELRPLYLKKSPVVEPRVLTIEEACQGIAGSEYLGPINRKSSPGYPWILSRPSGSSGKSHWLGKDNEWKLSSDLILTIEERIRRAKLNQRTPAIWTDTLKDERRPNAKVDEGKTRVFAAGPQDFTIVFRQYYLAFIATVMENRIDNEQCLGINPLSHEWGKLARKLQKFGNRQGVYPVIAGDFSNFDGSLNSKMMWKFCDMVCEWYQTFDPNFNEEDNVVRRILFEEVVNSIHIIMLGNEGIIYQWTHSQPSGSPPTTCLNSWINSFGIRLVYNYLAKKQNFREPFYKVCSFASYGDDNLMNISPVIVDWFNQNTITDAYVRYGYTYTDEAKTGNIVPFRKLGEVNFLKRGFLHENGIWKAPLDEDVCIEMMNWVRGDLDQESSTLENIATGITELYYHPKEVSEKWIPKIEKACLQAFGELPFILPYVEFWDDKIQNYLI